MTDSSNKTYFIYKHTSPSGKVYIGKTCYKKPEWRWRKNGSGYVGSPLFYNAIQKYGWECISHEILYSGLSREEANKIEKELISHYKNLHISYNLEDGGDNGVVIHSTEWNKHISEGRKGIKHTADAKRRMSKSHKGLKQSVESNKKRSIALMGKPKTESHKSHIKENHWDCSEDKHPNYGKSLPKSTREKIGRANSNKIAIHNDSMTIMINKDEWEHYECEGWAMGIKDSTNYKGRTPWNANTFKLIKDGVEKRYKMSDIPVKLADGWSFPSKHNENKYKRALKSMKR